jgi:hypothetical protein
MWLTLAAAGFFTIIVLATLLRAEKSVANGALTVITLLAIGVAVAASIRGFGTGGGGASGEAASVQTTSVSLPALSCIDDLAGETVLAACEKSLFGSAESAAAAVSYAASMITQLTASGDVAAANRGMTPELQAVRRAVERDRYGLMAQALVARDHCTLSECAAFRAITDSHQIVANMDQRTYDGMVSRYAPSWNVPAAAGGGAGGAVAALSPSMPTGRPTNAEFPSAASTPPVSIMTPEPGPTAPRAPGPAANTSAPAATTAPVLAAAKKSAPKPRHVPPAPAPVQLAPAAPTPAAPAASND